MTPALAGRLINEVRRLGIVVANLSFIDVSKGPFGNYLLATAVAGHANFLVTGDKADLLALGSYEGTRVITVRTLLVAHGRTR